MKTKIVPCLLIASILFYIGCYNTETVTKEQLKATSIFDITVITVDSLEYKFSKQHYSIVGDSLSGVGVQIIDVWPGENQFKGLIPFSNIAQIKKDEFNPHKTWFIVGTSLLVLSFVLVTAVASTMLNGHY